MPDFESLEDSGGVFVTPKTATRIITDLDKVERTPTENGRRRGHKNGQFIEQFVDVSDNTTTDGFYPCDVVCYNATTGGWQTFGSGWLKGPLGSEVFHNGDRVFARLNGTKASDGKPIWIAASSSAAATVLDECCDTNIVHGGGLSFGGGLVFGGAHCGCKPHTGCDCGCCGGGTGGGSSPPSSGGGGGNGCGCDNPMGICTGRSGWVHTYPNWSNDPNEVYWCGPGEPPVSPGSQYNLPGIWWGGRPNGCNGNYCTWTFAPGNGNSQLPGGGVGGIPPGTFPPSQPRPPMGGGGGIPRPPGAINNNCYTSCMAAESRACVPGSAGYAQCMATADAMCHHACDGFTRNPASLGGGIQFGSGVTLSGPPAPFLFANQGGLGIDASTAASGEVPIADGAGSFTMGTPSSSPANAQWLKLTKTYTDFSTAAFSNTITLRTFAAKEVLFSCIVKHSTSFSGGGITAYTIDVSDVTGVLLPGHITAFDAKQAVGNTAFQIGTRATGTTDTAFTDVSFAGANMLIKASCDGGHTLNQATQGSIDIWLLIGTMP